MNSSSITGRSHIHKSTRNVSSPAVFRLRPPNPYPVMLARHIRPSRIVLQRTPIRYRERPLSAKSFLRGWWEPYRDAAETVTSRLKNRLRGTCHACDLYPRGKSGNIGALSSSYAYQKCDGSSTPVTIINSCFSPLFPHIRAFHSVFLDRYVAASISSLDRTGRIAVNA